MISHEGVKVNNGRAVEQIVPVGSRVLRLNPPSGPKLIFGSYPVYWREEIAGKH